MDRFDPRVGAYEPPGYVVAGAEVLDDSVELRDVDYWRTRAASTDRDAAGHPPADAYLGDGRSWRQVMAGVRARLASDVAELEAGGDVAPWAAVTTPSRAPEEHGDRSAS